MHRIGYKWTRIGTHGNVQEIYRGAGEDDECSYQEFCGAEFPSTPFTGEEIGCEDKSFVKWHETFEEHASLPG